MIDRRDISYTQGSYLSPVDDGVLLQVAPTVNVDPGHYVSSTDPTIKPGSKYVKPQPRLKGIDPFEDVVGRAGGVGGLTFNQVLSFWNMFPLTGSAESMQEGALANVGGAMKYIEAVGFAPTGSSDDILDIPTVDFPGSEVPGLPALDLALPGSGDAVGDVFNIIGMGGSPGRAGEGSGAWVGGIGKILIIGAAALGGLYLVGKWIGRGKK